MSYFHFCMYISLYRSGYMSLSVVNILFCPVFLPLNVEGRAGDGLCGKFHFPQTWEDPVLTVSFIIFQKLQVAAKTNRSAARLKRGFTRDIFCVKMGSISCRKSLSTYLQVRCGGLVMNCACCCTLHTSLNQFHHPQFPHLFTSQVMSVIVSLFFKMTDKKILNLSQQPRTFQLYLSFVDISEIAMLVVDMFLVEIIVLFSLGEVCCCFF